MYCDIVVMLISLLMHYIRVWSPALRNLVLREMFNKTTLTSAPLIPHAIIV
jgi:hypothetical protein